MASVSNDPNGKKRILFKAPDGSGKRISLRLGKITKKSAEAVARYIQALLDAKIAGIAPPSDAAAWLSGISDNLRDKLVQFGVVEGKLNSSKETITLEDHLKSYRLKRKDVQPGTYLNWGHTCRSLLNYFGHKRLLCSITEGEAEDWQRWLSTGAAREHRYGSKDAASGLSPATIGKRTQNAIQFFKDAVKRGLILKNPFEGLKCKKATNKKRQFFVTREMAYAVLETIPDIELKLIFALARFAGLRVPSEYIGLRWEHIDWQNGRMLIHVPKLRHIEGKETRLVPIFPELRPYLELVWDKAELGAEFVITGYRKSQTNLRTQINRYIVQAGLKPWPKTFVNLRASMATELATHFPSHVEAEWVGHSEKIAKDHYLQVTEEDFNKAINGFGKVAQKAAQQVSALSGMEFK